MIGTLEVMRRVRMKRTGTHARSRKEQIRKDKEMECWFQYRFSVKKFLSFEAAWMSADSGMQVQSSAFIAGARPPQLPCR